MSLRKIGFGTYRVTIDNDSHYNTLIYAIKNGCRIIDTASNYKKGKSEELIGKVIKENCFEELGIDIISKAGYVDDDELIYFKNNSYKINNSFYYSFHPDFLSFKINKTGKRLKGYKIHAYLIHNPEYLLSCLENDIFYDRLIRSLHFLEGLVRKGEIKYYGISSNTIGNFDHPDHIDLNKILPYLKNNKGFKYIQFPFNYYENIAATKHYETKTLNLFEFASKNNLVTLINRPFLASINRRPVKLAIYENFIFKENGDELIEKLSSYIKIELENKNKDSNLLLLSKDFLFFSQNFRIFKSELLLNAFFKDVLFPLFAKFEIDISNENISRILGDIISFCNSEIKNTISKRNNRIRLEILKEKKDFDSTASFSSILCNYYFEQGADIVLTGMREKKYVNDLKEHFKKNYEH